MDPRIPCSDRRLSMLGRYISKITRQHLRRMFVSNIAVKRVVDFLANYRHYRYLKVNKAKVRSYIARYAVLGTAKSALPFTPWHTCSFQHHFDFSGKHSATLQVLREGHSFRYPSMSVARYSFIQLSELQQSGMNEIAKSSKRQQEDSNPGSID